MVTIEPNISVLQLSAVPPGSALQIDGQYGFSVSSERDPNHSLTFAAYNREIGQFVHKHGVGPVAIAYLSEIVIVPSLDSFTTGHRVSSNSGAELLMTSDGPKVVLHLESEYRLLNLATGIYSSVLGSSPGVFARWSVNLRPTTNSALVRLFDVGSP